eukprot:g36627.t1
MPENSIQEAQDQGQPAPEECNSISEKVTVYVEFAHSPRVCVNLLQVLQFPSTVQRCAVENFTHEPNLKSLITFGLLENGDCLIFLNLSAALGKENGKMAPPFSNRELEVLLVGLVQRRIILSPGDRQKSSCHQILAAWSNAATQ